MENETEDRGDPQTLLDDLAADRSALADRMRSPWWFNPGLGVAKGVTRALSLTVTREHGVPRWNSAIMSGRRLGLKA